MCRSQHITALNEVFLYAFNMTLSTSANSVRSDKAREYLISLRSTPHLTPRKLLPWNIMEEVMNEIQRKGEGSGKTSVHRNEKEKLMKR